MLTVLIAVNGKTIFAWSARNLTEDRLSKRSVCPYEVDDGGRVKHRYGDGMVPLAIQLLKRIKEV